MGGIGGVAGSAGIMRGQPRGYILTQAGIMLVGVTKALKGIDVIHVSIPCLLGPPSPKLRLASRIFSEGWWSRGL